MQRWFAARQLSCYQCRAGPGKVRSLPLGLHGTWSPVTHLPHTENDGCLGMRKVEDYFACKRNLTNQGLREGCELHAPLPLKPNTSAGNMQNSLMLFVGPSAREKNMTSCLQCGMLGATHRCWQGSVCGGPSSRPCSAGP
jgi:hypothetical protein